MSDAPQQDDPFSPDRQHLASSEDDAQTPTVRGECSHISDTTDPVKGLDCFETLNEIFPLRRLARYMQLRHRSRVWLALL